MRAAVPLTFRRSGSLPLQVSLELPDAGGERRKAVEQGENPHDTEAAPGLRKC